MPLPASDQNTATLAPMTSRTLHTSGRSRSRVASYWQRVEPRATGDEAIDDPVGEAKQPDFLCGCGIRRKPVRVIGIALRVAHLVGIPVAPDCAFAQQPVRGEPRAAEHKGRPPRVSEEHDDR